MSKKLIYIISGISCLTASFVGLSLYNKVTIQEKPLHQVKAKTPKKVVAKSKKPLKSADKVEVTEKSTPPKPTAKKVIIKSNNLSLAKVTFDELPGWDTADVKKSLLAFQKSCTIFLKQPPSHPIGSQQIKLKASDWHPACKAALELDSVTDESAKAFFEKWFHPIEFTQKPKQSLFTGYYMPQIKGTLTKSAEYKTPIYGLPKKGYSTHYTREQIDNGALQEKAPVIAWIHSPAERLFLEIEGSGVIRLPSGKSIYLGYAGENGAPYTSVAKVMINKGIMTRNTASKKAIIHYLEKHPGQAQEILHRNQSFVFFEDLKEPKAVGVKGMPLTPGYSLAVDKKWIPIGAPLWLNTKRPSVKEASEKQLQRLMIAQDTGGDIRGFMRGDIYWGSGKIATYLGEHMKNKGHYWLLLPKHILSRLAKKSI